MDQLGCPILLVTAWHFNVPQTEAMSHMLIEKSNHCRAGAFLKSEICHHSLNLKRQVEASTKLAELDFSSSVDFQPLLKQCSTFYSELETITIYYKLFFLKM